MFSLHQRRVHRLPDLSEVWLVYHTWALKYIQVFVRPAAKENVFICTCRELNQTAALAENFSGAVRSGRGLTPGSANAASQRSG